MELERLTPKQFERFQTFIYDCCGIKIDSSKITLVSNRIRRRLNAGAFADFDAYYQHLTSKLGVTELDSFLDAITTNETSYFRTAIHFDWLKNEFVKELLAEKSAGKREASIRVWSAACSSGEEPYSVAICLSEASVLLRGWNIYILGTDISESSLATAREAVYRQRTFRDMDPSRVNRYFTESDDTWRLKPNIAQMVKFKNHNLMKPLREPPFDCIFVRNVLIYFDRQSKASVIDNLVRSLVPGGYLVVGPSEGIYDMLGMLTKRAPFLYQKP